MTPLKRILLGLAALTLLVLAWVFTHPATPPPIPFIPHKPNLHEKIARVEVLDFYATWCVPCRVQKPIIDTLIAKGHKVRKIDIDHEPGLKAKYKVTSVPTYIVLRKGEEVYRTQSATDLKRFLEEKKWADPDRRHDRRENRRHRREREQPDEKSIHRTPFINDAVWR